MEKLSHCIVCDNPFRIKAKIGMFNPFVNSEYPLRKRNSITCSHKCSVTYNHTRDSKFYKPVYLDRIKKYLQFVEAQNGN
jgi:predicted nucleic acid-binding Zn ribbon protein